jgi:hypothetical protein
MPIFRLIFSKEGRKPMSAPWRADTVEKAKQHARNQLTVHGYDTVELFDDTGKFVESFGKPKAK